jgi:uncharacterized protein
MDLHHYFIAFGGALLAGAINTMAGNGSVITLGILTEIVGLPGNIANGTNRIGVLFNGAGGAWGFFRGGKLRLKGTGAIQVSVITGAIAGGVVAVKISDEQFMMIFRILMVVMLIVLIAKPARWMLEKRMSAIIPQWITYILYFILGVYGGVIQMGMGIFFLAIMVMLSRYPIMEANGVKAVVVTIYTFLMILLFHFHGMVQWPIGLLMGAGQFLGGWMTASIASKYPAMNRFAYYFLLSIVVLSIASLFELI